MAGPAPPDDSSHRLRAEYERAPRRFRFRLGALAFGLYVALALIEAAPLVLLAGLLAFVVLLGGATPLRFALVCAGLGLALAALLSFRIRLPGVTGKALAREQAPRLWERVDAARRATGAPAIEGLHIDDRLNAMIVGRPRALGLGGMRCHLVIGLPMLLCLEPGEFDFVLGHEFGHLRGGGLGSLAWILLLRHAWPPRPRPQANAARGRAKFARRLLHRPYRSFVARSQVLMQALEFEADAAAAAWVGGDVAAMSLVRGELGSRALEHGFWPAVHARSGSEPEPPLGLFREMEVFFRNLPDDDGERLATTLTRQPGASETHPTLARRLAALGLQAHCTPRSGRSAAALLPEDRLAALQDAFGRRAAEAMRPAWTRMHESRVRRADSLARLEALRDSRALDRDEALAYASLVHTLRKDQDAAPLYQALLQAEPDHPPLLARYGELLLERGQAAGIDYVERAIAADARLRAGGLQALRAYYRERGEDAEAERIDRRIEDGRSARAPR